MGQLSILSLMQPCLLFDGLFCATSRLVCGKVIILQRKVKLMKDFHTFGINLNYAK